MSAAPRCLLVSAPYVSDKPTLLPAGEIAQVTKQTAVHGFTCAVGILRPVLPLD